MKPDCSYFDLRLYPKIYVYSHFDLEIYEFLPFENIESSIAHEIGK